MIRLDKYLVENGYSSSRERARMAVESGCVKVNGTAASKCSQLVDSTDSIEYSNPIQFVSRGGLKLAKAIQEFGIDLAGKRILDVGASTGGFTDCALQNGAHMVYAVDVGRGQLHSRLRNHAGVRSIEETDFRNLQLEQLDNEGCAFLLADLSFISLQHLFPHVNKFLAPAGKLILLIKPQFEAGPSAVGRGGLVKDQRVHQRVFQELLQAAAQAGFFLEAVCYAPLVKGKNIEYLSLFGRDNTGKCDIRKLVDSAFISFSLLK